MTTELLKNQSSNKDTVHDRSSKFDVGLFEESNCCQTGDLNTPTSQSRAMQIIAMIIKARSGRIDPNNSALVLTLGKAGLHIVLLKTHSSIVVINSY